MSPPSPRGIVALATCARLPDLWTDDQVLLERLRTCGLEVETPVWNDPAADWSAYSLVVVRSTWDYWHRRDEYIAWAHHVAAVSTLLNPADVIEWNTHKGYLRDLAGAGVPTAATAWLDAGASVDLAALMADRGWSDVVVKPAVSAGAEDTLRLADVGLVALQALADRVLTDRDVMVQPYLSAVETSGERSLLFIDRVLTHAVRRPPYLIAGRFADSAIVAAAEGERALAGQVLDAIPHDLLYARVDMVPDEDGSLVLMEVELVEPQLFFALSPAATQQMCAAIEARIRGSE
ncbi:MAG TPA: hypothetical protein VNB94_08035, partial [Mycobacteriales bacterium]|nr:hypothetical protein [Mycobacteriales bacterium]